MNDIEKRARELLAAEYSLDGREQFERGEWVVVTTASALNAIIAALTLREGELLAGRTVNLLDQQHSGGVVAQALDVIPATAIGADEAGAIGIGGQGDHAVGVKLAEVAAEHGVGVLPAHDRHVTPQWQPIETAPRDWQPVLLDHPSWQPRVLRGAWDAREMAWNVNGYCPAAQPTHWMPLPAAPEVKP